MTHRFLEYQPLKGGIPERQNGSLVSMEKGKAIPYSIDTLQERGTLLRRSQVRTSTEDKLLVKTARQDDLAGEYVTKTKKRSVTSVLLELLTQ